VAELELAVELELELVERQELVVILADATNRPLPH
jgi:hypothetical protein